MKRYLTAFLLICFCGITIQTDPKPLAIYQVRMIDPTGGEWQVEQYEERFIQFGYGSNEEELNKIQPESLLLTGGHAEVDGWTLDIVGIE